jgi:drug/metabolite transporter (DMT)-like permease
LPPDPKIYTRVYAALAVAFVATSAAATLVRKAQGEALPSLVIAAGRLWIAVAALSPFVLFKHREALRALSARDWGLLALSGLALAVHFGAWISSLEFTSVAASVALGSTSSIFALMLAWTLLGERATRSLAAGTALAVLGGLAVAASDESVSPPTRSAPLLGNGLALFGALALAVHFVLGRRLRARLHFLPYAAVVYGWAAIFLSVACWSQGLGFLGHSTPAYLWLLAIGLIPQLLGHSAFNYVLGHVSAARVSLMGRLEPVGSIALAAVVLGERPGPLALAGAGLVVAGVAVAGLRDRPGASPSPRQKP